MDSFRSAVMQHKKGCKMKRNKLEVMDTKFLENSAACCLGYLSAFPLLDRLSSVIREDDYEEGRSCNSLFHSCAFQFMSNITLKLSTFHLFTQHYRLLLLVLYLLWFH